jgi:hypothetical protein
MLGLGTEPAIPEQAPCEVSCGSDSVIRRRCYVRVSSESGN